MIEVVTYRASDNAPAGEEAIARLRAPLKSAKGKLVMTWSPVIITASTEVEARLKAHDWWLAQLEAEERKRLGIERAIDGRRNKSLSASDGAPARHTGQQKLNNNQGDQP